MADMVYGQQGTGAEGSERGAASGRDGETPRCRSAWISGEAVYVVPNYLARVAEPWPAAIAGGSGDAAGSGKKGGPKDGKGENGAGNGERGAGDGGGSRKTTGGGGKGDAGKRFNHHELVSDNLIEDYDEYYDVFAKRCIEQCSAGMI